MSRSGNVWDNAAMESFFSSPRTERIGKKLHHTRDAIGSVTGVSISALFTGGPLPGLVLGLTLCMLVWWRYRGEDLSAVKRPNGRTILKSLAIAFPALPLPFVIRAAVVEGVATATEVSTIGIVYAVLVGLVIYRQFPVKRLYPMLVTTASLSGAILLIMGAATGMAGR